LSEKLEQTARYKPCLDEFLSQCEVNYFLLLKLFPFLDVKKNNYSEHGDTPKIAFETNVGSQLDFELIEKAPYTTTMMLKLNVPIKAKKNKMSLMLRLYHDVKLVEVMDKIGPKAIKPLIKGNGLSRHQTDEKRQLNRFLGESLNYCLAGSVNGCSEISL
jgi:uncharacterized protein